MGIEPTGRTASVRPNGFEDRGHHQVYKHFHTLPAYPHPKRRGKPSPAFHKRLLRRAQLPEVAGLICIELPRRL